jgi:hypothetical protein
MKPIPARYGPAIIAAHLAQHRAMGTRIVIGDKVKAQAIERAMGA